MKESEYSKQVTEYVKERGGEVFNYLGTTMTRSGTPDLLVAYRGAFVGLELKVGNNKPSALQKHTVNLLNEKGAYAIVAYDTLEPIEKLFNDIDADMDYYVHKDEYEGTYFGDGLNIVPERYNYTGGTK